MKADLPGVGKNLHDHLLTFVIHEASREIPAPKHNVLEAHLFAKTDARLPAPDHQPLFMCNAPPLPGLDIPPNSYAIAPGIIRPVSRGELKLTADDPAAPLHIDPRYLSEPADLNALVHSLEVSIEIMESPAFAKWRKRSVWPKAKTRAERDAMGAADLRDVSSPGRHLQNGHRRHERRRSANCGFTASKACASPMPRSCRR